MRFFSLLAGGGLVVKESYQFVSNQKFRYETVKFNKLKHEGKQNLNLKKAIFMFYVKDTVFDN